MCRIGGVLSKNFGHLANILSVPCVRRGGLPRGTGPRCLPETARLRGVPNPGEGLPFRVSRQLPGGSRRTGHLLHPPSQQTQEIHVPVHWRVFVCPGSGESCQVRLYKVFFIKKKKKEKTETTPSADFSVLQTCSVFLLALLDPPPPVVQDPNSPWGNHAQYPPPPFFKPLKNKQKKSFFSCQCWTDDWCFLGGDVELYCKVRKQTYFLLWSGEKDKKNTHTHTQKLTFSFYLLLFVGHDDSNGVPHLSLPWRTDVSLTADHFLTTDFLLPVPQLCVLGVTLVPQTHH